MTRNDPQASGATAYPTARVCGCSHLEPLHDIGQRNGEKVRTGCSVSTCNCTRFEPVEEDARCSICGAHLDAIEAARLE